MDLDAEFGLLTPGAFLGDDRCVDVARRTAGSRQISHCSSFVHGPGRALGPFVRIGDGATMDSCEPRGAQGRWTGE